MGEKNPRMMMEISNEILEQVRSRFPAIDADKDGQRIFFDNGAGSLSLKTAIDAEAITRVKAAPNRGGVYGESKVTEQIILQGRQAIADLLNAPNPNTIVQGDSASDLFFKVAFALAHRLSASDNVVSTNMEHYANVAPYLELKKRGILGEVRLAKLNKYEGTLNLNDLQDLVDKHTKVIAVSASSNLLGTRAPVKHIARIAHDAGAYLVVDAVHHVPQGAVDVQELDSDFLVFSGYKLFGPHGGYMHVKEDLFPRIEPFHVDPNASGKIVPSNFELGTRDPAKFAAMEAVIDYLVWLDSKIRHKENPLDNISKMNRTEMLKEAMDTIESYGRELTEAILFGCNGERGITEIPNVKIFGMTNRDRLSERDCTFTFKVSGINDARFVERLWNNYRIAARSGHYWNNAEEYYNLESAIRVTLLHYNTKAEVAKFLRAVAEISNERT